ncbi:hyphally regulated cell wall protein 3-like [Camellia sinensis]|uniref:hyphally regulated cell wall protein 3-like n=1 Tax=Camellia sinensis TaxID=4442 RepID=UPI001035E82C|nr:hyphally regulated cell wall protein 3-like [Camellia sinensis]
MPLLIGVRAITGRTGDIASSSRARAADIPSTSRARAADAPSTSRAQVPRGGAKEMPSTRQSVGWPDLSTELTGWRYFGVPFQILLEPLLPDHRYVRTPDSPPVTPFQTGPSEPSPAAGRKIPAHGRGRGREPVMHDDYDETSEDEEPVSPQSESSEGGGDGTGTGSGSESGDDVEEGSEDGNGDSSGSGSSSDSDSGAGGDSSKSAQPRKKTKRASQS